MDEINRQIFSVDCRPPPERSAPGWQATTEMGWWHRGSFAHDVKRAKMNSPRRDGWGQGRIDSRGTWSAIFGTHQMEIHG